MVTILDMWFFFPFPLSTQQRLIASFFSSQLGNSGSKKLN